MQKHTLINLAKGISYLFCFFYPVYSILLTALAPKYFKKSGEKIIILALLSFIPGIIASTQKATGTQTTDIVRYQENYERVSERSASEILEQGILHYPLFRLTNHAMSNLLGQNFKFATFFWVALFYFVSFLSIFILLYHKGRFFWPAIWIAFLGILNFPQASELLKQQPAYAFIALSLALFHRKRKIASGFSLLAAFGLHYSTYVFIPLSLAAFSLYGLISFAVISVIMAFFNTNELIYYSCRNFPFTSHFVCSKAKRYIEFLNWEITLREHISLFTLYCSTLAGFALKLFKNLSFTQRVIISYALFLLMNINTAHNFIRFLHAGAPLFALSMAWLLADASVQKHKYGKAFTSFLAFLFIGYHGASIFMRVTRETYQSTYLNNEPWKLLYENLFYFLSSS